MIEEIFSDPIRQKIVFLIQTSFLGSKRAREGHKVLLEVHVEEIEGLWETGYLEREGGRGLGGEGGGKKVRKGI